MKTITVAGISIREDKKNQFTYEQLFDMAKRSITYLRVKDADSKIDKELKKNGFKPSKKVQKSAKADKPGKD